MSLVSAGRGPVFDVEDVCPLAASAPVQYALVLLARASCGDVSVRQDLGIPWGSRLLSSCLCIVVLSRDRHWASHRIVSSASNGRPKFFFLLGHAGQHARPCRLGGTCVPRTFPTR